MNTQKILIVDNDPEIINGIREILSQENYEVISAQNMADGLSLARMHRPDLTILDARINTNYEGFDLAGAFVNDPEFEGMPIILQTSMDMFTTTKESVREMAHAFRREPGCKNFQVILMKDIVTGKAGIDYQNEEGKTFWLPLGGILPKPVNINKLLPEIESALSSRSMSN